VTLPAPNLDDRAFQDLVDEAKRMVQRRCPEWTDNNVADPGVTLIETFAYMVDQLIYRLNRVPDLNYIKFLELLGEHLRPPAAAIAPVKFSLAVPQPVDVLIPAGTLVSTTRRGTDRQIIFSTSDTLTLASVQVISILTQSVGGQPVAHEREMAMGSEFDCFSPVPEPGDAMYVGLTKAAPGCIVRVNIDSRIEGIGVDPLRPPLIVEAWDGQSWVHCRLLASTTGGLNRKGYADVHVVNHVESMVGGVSAGWIRMRVVETVGDQPAYSSSPKVRQIEAATIAGIVDVSQSQPVVDEILGTCTGTPNERMQLNRFPLISGQSDLTIEVSTPNGWTVWTRVESFAQSTASDQHFMIDDVNGILIFGPMIREQDGSVRYYGRTPDAGATVRIPRYLVGGGREGNVEAGVITVLRSSIPFVSKVENTQPAVGGVEAESIEDMKARAALTVRTRNRAVTARDYEQLIAVAAPSLTRIRCIEATELGKPGLILVLVIPEVPAGHFGFELLEPRAEVLADVREYLDPRRPLGITVHIEPPRYLGVSVMVRIAVVPGFSKEQVVADADLAIANFLHPNTGGYDGKGWPFGRQLVLGDIHGVLQHIPGLAYVDLVRLVAVDAITGARGEPGDRVQPEPLDLLFNMSNDIEVIS
jgi:predicted phage baseplate assembly protein